MKEKDSLVIKRDYVYFVVVAVLFLAVGFLVSSVLQKTTGGLVSMPNTIENVVESGDTIKINYIGKFENGTVFDTSYEEVGKEEGLSRDSYGPLEFTVGSGQVIPGLDGAVIGMKMGDEKTVTIPPEKAYGFRDESLILGVPREQKISRVQNLSLEEFRQVLGDEPVVGMAFQPEAMQWPVRVLNITNATVVIAHEPEPNLTIQTIFGKAEVALTDTKILIMTNPIPSMVVMTMSGPAKVLSVNETTISLDFNHELAGKTLIFTVKVEDVVKG